MSMERLRIPPLRDWHTHPLLYAAFMDGIDLGRDPSETREMAISRIRAETRGPGWTIASGWNSGRYDLPSSAFDDLPPLVVLNLSLHGLFVNDAGLARLRRFDPVMADNLSDQEWVERNLLRVLSAFAGEGASADRLHRYYQHLLEDHGVYHAEEMLLVGEDEVRLFDEAGLSERTRFWAAPDMYDRLSRQIQERVHGIKLFADGALGARTAAIASPYQGSTNTGMLLYGRETIESLLARYLGAGKPVAVHAIGDRAIDQVVSAVAAIGPREDCEVRVEHAQFISEGTATRAKTLGIQLCMQPNFSDDSLCYADRLPAGYQERNNPFRMLIDRVGYVPGVDLLFGSDGMPPGIDDGLRQSLFPPFPGQLLTIDEFKAGYCMNDESVGFLDVEIDRNERRVTHRVVLRGR